MGKTYKELPANSVLKKEQKTQSRRSSKKLTPYSRTDVKRNIY